MPDITSLNLKLGKKGTNDASLDAVPRNFCRKDLELSGIEMFGVDIWNAYEVSFLLPSGLPAVFVLRCGVPANSPNMMESKSFKLHLFDQANRVFKGPEAFLTSVQNALEQCVGSKVMVRLFPAPPRTAWDTPRRILEGIYLDSLPVKDLEDNPDAALIQPNDGQGEWKFFSHLVMTHCPVTNQPDFASIQIGFSGPKGVETESLLRYLLAFRGKQMFHESFCERVFIDLIRRLEPQRLDVICFFCRRGGIDINPYRTTDPNARLVFSPTWRQ